jgi:ABC-type multidrug transport system fused ATPase/permease subunit
MENKNNKILRISDYIQGAKLIWKEIAYGHKKDAVWLVALSLFIAICDGIVPLVSGRFFDSLSHIQENIFGVWITLSLLLLLTILSALGTDRKNTHGGWIGTLLYTEYIARSTKILFRLPMKFYNNTAVSELDQKMHRAANGVQNMFQNVILELLPAFLSIGVVFVTIISINLALSGVIILGVALYAIFLLRTIGNGALYTRNQADAWTKVWRERADGLYNIAIVKQSASEKHEDNKNDANLIDNATKNDRVLWQLWARVSIAQKIITLATQATVLIISVYMLRNGSLTPGQVIAFNAYVGMVFGPFLRLGNIWRHIQNNVIHITSANEILSTEPEKYSSPETIAQDIKGKVVFEDVSFWHDPRKKILDKLSFEAEAGSVVAFVGKTGAGKSSLTELIYRFHEIQKGKILIDDIPVEKFESHKSTFADRYRTSRTVSF